MNGAIARMLVDDYNAFKADRSGTRLCPNLDQLALAQDVLAGKEVPVPSADSDRILPYFKPSDAPAADPQFAITVEFIERHKTPKNAIDPVIADLGHTHGAVAAAHGLKLSPRQSQEVADGVPVSEEQATRMPTVQEDPEPVAEPVVTEPETETTEEPAEPVAEPVTEGTTE